MVMLHTTLLLLFSLKMSSLLKAQMAVLKNNQASFPIAKVDPPCLMVKQNVVLYDKAFVLICSAFVSYTQALSSKNTISINIPI